MYGQDTPAYADTILEVPLDATDEQIIEQAKAFEFGDLVFDPSWDWSGARIVEIADTGSDGRIVAADVPLEVSGEDLGLITQLVLRGQSHPKALLEEAERQGLVVEPSIRSFLENWPTAVAP